MTCRQGHWGDKEGDIRLGGMSERRGGKLAWGEGKRGSLQEKEDLVKIGGGEALYGREPEGCKRVDWGDIEKDDVMVGGGGRGGGGNT